MLNIVLDAVDRHNQPVNLQTLSSELEIDAGALEGMLDFWVRKGKVAKRTPAAPDCTLCSTLCSADSACPLLAALPVTYMRISSLRPVHS
jgi:hypothetical protein